MCSSNDSGRLIAAILFAAALALPASTALAHPDLDEAVDRYERAEFEAARAALTRALRQGSLDRAELSLLLSTSALVHYALRDIEAMERALAQLASIEPAFEWGPATAPDVLAAFARAKEATPGTIAIAVEVEPDDDTIALSVNVTGDSAELVASVELAARTAGEWLRTSERELAVPRDGERVAYYAVARGPGGAELAREGSADAPSERELPPRAPEIPPSDTREVRAAAITADEDADGVSPWPWLALGVGIAAALGIVLGLVIFSSESELVGPQVDWMGDG